jgi:hypothetical protein
MQIDRNASHGIVLSAANCWNVIETKLLHVAGIGNVVN